MSGGPYCESVRGVYGCTLTLAEHGPYHVAEAGQGRNPARVWTDERPDVIWQTIRS